MPSSTRIVRILNFQKITFIIASNNEIPRNISLNTCKISRHKIQNIIGELKKSYINGKTVHL